MFKVIRSNIEIAITPPRIARLRSNLLYRVSSRHRCATANVHGQRSRSQLKVMYRLQKRYVVIPSFVVDYALNCQFLFYFSSFREKVAERSPRLPVSVIEYNTSVICKAPLYNLSRSANRTMQTT